MEGTIFIAAVGIVTFITGAVTSNLRLEMIGLPMAGFSIFAVMWQEHKAALERKAGSRQGQASVHATSRGTATEVVFISTSSIFSKGNPELKTIIREENYEDLVRDIVQPYLSILLVAAPAPEREASLMNLFVSIERVKASHNLDAQQTVLQEL